MLCKCPNCSQTFIVNGEELIEKKVTRFLCPLCSSPVQIPAELISCGKCATKMKFYPFKFMSSSSIVKCKNCGSFNRVKINTEEKAYDNKV